MSAIDFNEFNRGIIEDFRANDGTERYAATARTAEGDERQTLWDAQAALMPNFDEYQQKTTRQIPVVVLERVS